MDERLDHAPCGYVSFDDEGLLTDVNATLAQWLGRSREAMVGQHIETLLTVAGRIFYQTHLFPLIKLHGKAEEIFLTLRGAGGEGVPMLANLVRVEGPGAARNECVLVPVWQRRKYEDELLAARRQAEEALRTNEELTRIRAELDLHARELDRKVSRLEHQNTEVTRVSTILSHDLREPIRKLSVFADVLGQESREHLSPLGVRAIEVIGSECVRLSALVRGLHEYVSLDTLGTKTEPVDLARVLREARAMVEARYKTTLDMVEGPLPVLTGQRRQLELLFNHLLDNAVKFARPGTTPRVRVGCREVQENSFQATEGRYRYVDCVLVTVEDDGIGFDARFNSYIFEALRKLDPESPGVGLGLAICKKVAANHFGWIKGEPGPSGGARFTLMLPMQQ